MGIRYGDRSRVSTGVDQWLNPQKPNEYDVFDASSASVAASSTINTKGSWTQIIASTTVEAGWLVYNYTNFANATATTGLVDIGIGSSGNEVVLISNLPCGYGNNTTPITIPISLPPGTRISARTQSVISSRSATISLGVKKNTHGLQLTTVDTFNADTATSSFTSSSSTAYVELVASTSSTYKALAFHISNRTETAIANSCDTRFTIAIGAAGAEVDVATISRNANSSEYFSFGPIGTAQMGLYVSQIPAGTRISAKGPTNANAGVLVYGIF